MMARSKNRGVVAAVRSATLLAAMAAPPSAVSAQVDVAERVAEAARGIVYDSQGRPVGGATVVFAVVGRGSLSPQRPVAVPSVKTDARGVFAVAVPTSGTLRAWAHWRVGTVDHGTEIGTVLPRQLPMP